MSDSQKVSEPRPRALVDTQRLQKSNFALRLGVAQLDKHGAAHNSDYIIKQFRARIKEPQAFKRVESNWKNYIQSCKFRGPAQKELLRRHPEALFHGIRSMRIYSDMPAPDARRMAFTRCLMTLDPKRYNAKVNLAALGNARSLARTNDNCVEPGNQVSLEMRTPFMRSDGTIKHPIVLSVSAPDLSKPGQPEWKHYVDIGGRLREKEYRKSLQTLGSHILNSSRLKPRHRVVLSAFGMANFLGGLSPKERQKAKDIGAEVFTDIITSLRKNGATVAFTDVEPNGEFWAKVNNALSKNGSTFIPYVGKLPGRWIEDKDIAVNSGDPESLLGNGCLQDNSCDGIIGANTMMHETHAAACSLYQNGALRDVANIPVER